MLALPFHKLFSEFLVFGDKFEDHNEKQDNDLNDVGDQHNSKCLQEHKAIVRVVAHVWYLFK